MNHSTAIKTIIFSVCVIFAACSKDKNPNPTSNTEPIVSAGYDTIITGTYFQLKGSVTGLPLTELKRSWHYIIGPEYYTYDSGSPEMLVFGLIPGNYEFEFRVEDADGKIYRDTISIQVLPLPDERDENTLIFEKLTWNDTGCFLELTNVQQYLPAGKIFNVYLRNNLFSNWIKLHAASEANRGMFFYDFNNGRYIIQTENLDCGFDDREYYDVKLELLN